MGGPGRSGPDCLPPFAGEEVQLLVLIKAQNGAKKPGNKTGSESYSVAIGAASIQACFFGRYLGPHSLTSLSL